jgi:hypothetical protein
LLSLFVLPALYLGVAARKHSDPPDHRGSGADESEVVPGVRVITQSVG